MTAIRASAPHSGAGRRPVPVHFPARCVKTQSPGIRAFAAITGQGHDRAAGGST